MNLSILVVDSESRRGGIIAALRRAAPKGASLEIFQHAAGDADWDGTAPGEGPFDLAFCHATNVSGDGVAQTISDPISKAKVRVCYSGGGQPDLSELAGSKGWFSVPRRLNSESAASSGEWREFLKWATSCSASPGSSANDALILPRLLRFDFPRVATALLILCRAALALLDCSIIGAEERRTVKGIRKWMSEPFAPPGDILKQLGHEVGSEEEVSNELKILISWLEQGNDDDADKVLISNSAASGGSGALDTPDIETDLHAVLIEAEKCLAGILDANS